MKNIGLAALALTGLVATAASASDAKFEFRQLTADTTLSAAREAGLISRCTGLGSQRRGSLHCFMSREWNAQPVSGYEIGGGGIEFGPDGKLESYSSVIEREAFATIAEAFALKYGEPCEVRVEVLQNGFGATIPSQVRTWCFVDGSLTISSVAPGNVTKAIFEFRVKADRAPASVNF